MNLKQHLKLAKLSYKIMPFVVAPKGKRYFSELRFMLDDDYHANITDEQFRKLGHIYYGGKVERRENRGK